MPTRSMAASKSFKQSDGDSIPPVVKVAVGIGIAVVGLLLVVLLVSSRGKSSSAQLEEASPEQTANVNKASRGAFQERDYQLRFWVSYTDATHRFTQWFPRKGKEETKTEGVYRRTTVTSWKGETHSYRLSLAVAYATPPVSPRKAIEEAVAEMIAEESGNPEKRVISKQWKVIDGQEVLDVEASIEYGTGREYTRFHVGDDYMAALSYVVMDYQEPDIEAREMFLNGFRVNEAK